MDKFRAVIVFDPPVTLPEGAELQTQIIQSLTKAPPTMLPSCTSD
jgi:hypothetical protein